MLMETWKEEEELPLQMYLIMLFKPTWYSGSEIHEILREEMEIKWIIPSVNELRSASPKQVEVPQNTMHKSLQMMMDISHYTLWQFLIPSIFQASASYPKDDGINSKTVLFMHHLWMIRSSRTNCNALWCRSEQSEFCHFKKISLLKNGVSLWYRDKVGFFFPLRLRNKKSEIKSLRRKNKESFYENAASQ